MDILPPLPADYGLFAIVAVMLLKEAGVPVPIPSDLIMITAGVQAAAGAYSVLELVVLVGIAAVTGSTIQYALMRGPGRGFVRKYGRYAGLNECRLDRAAAVLKQRGALAVFVGLNVPGARAGIIAAAGLADIPYLTLAPATAAGSLVYYGWHIALGYLAGPGAGALLSSINVPLLPIMGALALAGLAAWLLLYRRSRAAALSAATDIRSWTEAACPACLAAAAVQRLRSAGGSPPAAAC